MEHHIRHKAFARSFFSSGSRVVMAFALLFTACSAGGDSDQAPNTPLSIPMALVVNQDDTTMTTVRLDRLNSPVISTLSLGPAQADSIGGVGFSLGEWIFVTNTNTNKVAAIDPIGGLKPILEDFLDVNGPVRLGQRPTRIYRDPVDKEVLLTMNQGDPVTGLDTIRGCQTGGSVTALHNSHLSAGGEKPRVTTTVCLSGVGEHFVAFSRPPAVSQEIAFVTSQITGIVSPLLADPSFGAVRWSELPSAVIDLCDNAKEQALGFPACDAGVTTPNHALPSGVFWSRATSKIYSFLSGYQAVVEIDPVSFAITRRVDVPQFQNTEITPDGRFLFVTGEDITSDPAKLIGRFGFIDLTQPALSLVSHSLDHVRSSQFRFTADGNRLYVTQSNATIGLTSQQAAALEKDKLYVFDTATWPASFPLLTSIALPAVGPLGVHGLDLWVTGPKGAGSATGIVVTNAPHAGNGSVSLIDAATNTITTTIPVGRNPKQVTVYYAGLAASDNQATPTQ